MDSIFAYLTSICYCGSAVKFSYRTLQLSKYLILLKPSSLGEAFMIHVILVIAPIEVPLTTPISHLINVKCLIYILSRGVQLLVRQILHTPYLVDIYSDLFDTGKNDK